MAAPPGFAVGWFERVIVPSPAAGANFTYTIDGRYKERLLSARFTLVTSAVVANRFPVLHLLDVNSRVVASAWAGGTIPASTMQTQNLAREFTLQSNYGGSEVFGPLPDWLMPEGYSWQSSVQNIDAGDQINAITLLVERFPNDAAIITVE